MHSILSSLLVLASKPAYTTATMSASHLYCLLALHAIIAVQSPAGNSAMAAATPGNQTDRIALLELKSLLRDKTGGAGALASWNDSLNFCEWTGVKCGPKHQRVVALNLQGQELSGVISPFLGNLSFLGSLNLSNNYIEGRIPAEIAFLTRLKNLGLSNNALGGGIPINLSRCAHLVNIELDDNLLHDRIPPEVGALSNLQKLSLSNNNLTGGIPASFGNLSSLETLDLFNNNFEGEIPSTIGQTRLRYFIVSENQFNGGFPTALYNLSNLNTIRMYHNNFSGSIRSDIGLLLPNLQLFILGDNQYTGSIPASLCNVSGLIKLDFPSNDFTGNVPASFGRLQNLIRLNVNGNSLGVGEIDGLSFLTYLANCTNLQLLDFSNNRYSGQLPVSITNLSSQLSWLDIAGNSIFGSIPAEIAYLNQLEHLGMNANMLSGIIPESIGQLSNLNYLCLGQNKLTGQMPFTIGNITRLLRLYLYNNSLEGSIPSSLGDCSQLQDLRLCHNKFSGTIPIHLIDPSSLLIHLNVSHNALSGPLPAEIGNLKDLVALDVSHNEFSGEIPYTLGNCLGLEQLYMQENSFQGNIPLLRGLKGIQFLDLSANDISGEIPSYMGTFTSLQFINLSFNNLEGPVPSQGIFRNLSAIDVAGNKKLCGGISLLHLSPCHSILRKHMSSRWIALIIVLCCLAAAGCSASLCWRRKLKEKEISPESLGHFYLKISYDDLFSATQGFSSSNLVGSGTFGRVYKGTLTPDGSAIAVKVLNLNQKGAFKSFIAECKALSNIRHRNLVRILTACSSVDSQGNEFKALVYEFMGNGSLDMWLHPKEDLSWSHLSFQQRISIAIDVASALDYLHHQCQNPLAHCDIKPSNVLLDAEKTAHLSDFGLSKLLLKSGKDILSSQFSSGAFKGTMGYVAPEYGMGLQPSTTGDVYSFGILLLELFTGRRPTDDIFQEDFNLHKYVKMALPDKVTEIMDQALLLHYEDDGWSDWESGQLGCLISVLSLGLICSAESPIDRKKMGEVVAELLAVKDRLLKSASSQEENVLSPVTRCMEIVDGR